MADTSFIHYDRIVIGYHGTDRAMADRLVSGDPFDPSVSESEWLGTGIYFWEHAPKQAWDWASRVRRHPNPAVVGAVFRLGNCFDLLDPGNVAVLRTFKDTMVDQLTRAGEPVPANHRSHKKLDCAVFNFVREDSLASGRPVDSFRAAYVPADRYKRVWKQSWINVESHIQICLASVENIIAAWPVKADGSYGRDP